MGESCWSSTEFLAKLLCGGPGLFPSRTARSRALCDFYRAINKVEPGLIRVEADEATYNLHIILRFQLEQELINGELETDDLPTAWNEKYEQYFGITPTTDVDGVLQDIHWSSGAIRLFSDLLVRQSVRESVDSMRRE